MGYLPLELFMKRKLIIFLALALSINNVSAINAVDEIAEQYVKLVLALGEHDASYVDAYYGPEEWQQAANKNKIPITKIVQVADNLKQILKKQSSADPLFLLRLDYLRVQLSAVRARAIMMSGENNWNFDAQSRMLYDTEAPHYKLNEFEATLKALDKLLPGDIPLSQKAENFRKRLVIPKDKLEAVFKIAISECRNRTHQFINLLENENFTLEYVQNKPWSGYNWYKGNAFSLIQVNAEHPIPISRAIDLGCHEGYPGHHTYNALLEENLVKKRGWIEFSVYPLFSPQSLIAEGSANYGIEMAFPGEEKLRFEKEVLFPIAGINKNLADDYQQFSELTTKLNYAGNELARLYLNGKIDKQQAIQMIQHYTLASKEKAAQRVDFWNTYGAYVINYNWGKDLVKQWVESGPDQSREGRWKRFAKLLSSPRLPSTLN